MMHHISIKVTRADGVGYGGFGTRTDYYLTCTCGFSRYADPIGKRDATALHATQHLLESIIAELGLDCSMNLSYH